MSHCWAPLGHPPAMLSWRDVPVDAPAVARSCTQLPSSKVLPKRSTEMVRNTSLRNRGNSQQDSCLRSYRLQWDEDSESSCRPGDHKKVQRCTAVNQRTNTKNCLSLQKVEVMQMHPYTPRRHLHIAGISGRTLQHNLLCLSCRNRTKKSNTLISMFV